MDAVKHDAFYLWLSESWHRPRWQLSAGRKPAWGGETHQARQVKALSHLHKSLLQNPNSAPDLLEEFGYVFYIGIGLNK